MHEKTLLGCALAVTALGCALGVYRERSALAERGPVNSVAMAEAPNDVADSASPIQLTASDGSGIRLVAMTASAVVEDPLALTELHLVFENPEDRVREGTFRITLPRGASLSRFAMKVGDVWQEGEVVEKQAARRAYEDFLHRKQDPALLEQGGGNEFTARVFPIPAAGKKELVLTYAQVLGRTEPYTLPLKGLSKLGTLDVDVQAASSRASSFGLHKQGFAPGADFVVAAKDLPRGGGLRSGELAVVRVVPYTASRPDPIASAIVLVDTSASRALGLRDQADLLRGVLAALGAATVTVAAFDQEIEPLYEGKASGFGPEQITKLVERGALGGSNLERALEWAGAEAKKARAKRVILLTDGVATIGETDAQKLRADVEPLRAAGVERIDAVAVGGIRDDGLLRTLVRGVLDKDGVVLDSGLGAEAIARRLDEATTSGIPVTIPGSAWSWPKTLDGMQAGDEVMVFAKMQGAGGPLKVLVGPQTVAADARSIDRPLLERAVAQAEIQGLIEAPTKDAAATKRDIIALSTKHRVLSPHTALLVLETDQDYARFAIDRNAKVDILAVRGGRVAVVQSDRQDALSGQLVMKAKGGSDEETTVAPGRAAAGARRAGGTARSAAPAPAAAADVPMQATASDRGPDPGAHAAEQAALEAQADAMQMEALAALGRDDTSNSGGLRIGGGGSPVQGGGRGAGLAGIGGSGAAGAAGAAARVEAPRAEARIGSAVLPAGAAITDVDRVLAGLRARFRNCYQTGLNSDPSMTGDLVLDVEVAKDGEVSSATTLSNTGLSPATAQCVAGVVRRATFAAPGSNVRFRVPVSFVSQPGTGGGSLTTNGSRAFEAPPKPPAARPYDGPVKVVMDLLAQGDKVGALASARSWQAKSSGDVMALVGLGEALEATGDPKGAARAYGSIFELFASRADSRRFAGERLERLQGPMALELAVDTYGKAVLERPDHPASHRLYAFALVKAGQYAKAFEAIVAGKKRVYPPNRFRGVDRILKEDVGLVAAAWMKAEPKRAAEITRLRDEAGGADENNPSVRFVLVWETDANDVDFHIYDGKGGHAYYGSPQLASGGDLYADVTTGYGPECFTIRGAREGRAYPYTLQAHYYSRGPMGYGMGKLQIIDHDGKGGLTFEERPFVVMVDRAFVDLGVVERPKH